MRTAPYAAVFFDRSPVCTLALSRFLGFATSDLLAAELRGLARLEELHERTYRELGFPSGAPARRAAPG